MGFGQTTWPQLFLPEDSARAGLTWSRLSQTWGGMCEACGCDTGVMLSATSRTWVTSAEPIWHPQNPSCSHSRIYGVTGHGHYS